MEDWSGSLKAVLELSCVCTDEEWPQIAQVIQLKVENELAKVSQEDQLGNQPAGGILTGVLEQPLNLRPLSSDL
jgi:hypothetical protein